MTDKVQKIHAEVEKQLNLLEKVAEKLKNGLITSGNVSHTGKVQGYTIENVVNNIKEILQKEPVEEDFEKALASEWKAYNDRGAATVDALEDNTQELAFAKGFYRGSNWQKVQDQSTIELAEDHAMLAGMEKMREEMMAKAIKGNVIEDIEEGNGDFLLNAEYLPKSMGLKDGQEVKVIVIKED